MDAIALAFAADLALGLFLLALAALAPRAARPGPSRWLLAAYLALVGLDYVSDGLARLLDVKTHTPLLDWLSIGTQALDPPVLFLFALAVTGARVRWSRALPACAGILLVTFRPQLLGIPVQVGPFAYAAVALAAYVGSFALLARSHLAAADGDEREPRGVLVVAFGVVCLTRVPLALIDFRILPVGPPGRQGSASWMLEALLFGAFVAFALLSRAFARPSAWPHARRVLIATGALLTVLDGEWLLRFVPYLQAPSYALLWSARWFLFLAVVIAGLRRHDLLGLSATVAPWLRRTYAALLGVVAAVLAASFARALPGVSDLGAAAAGAAVVGAGVGAGFAIRAAVPRTPSEAEWRRAAVYRAHLALGSPPAELDAARRELGLSEREARAIASAFRVEREVPADALPERVEPGHVLLGRYRVERVLGVGAFGRAYSAVDLAEERRVVLKELLPSWRGDEEALARFLREAEVALRVRHPNLVGLRGIERLASGHVLVLDHVEGETLAARLARGPLEEAESRRLARDVLEALDALHRRGILHRDVKPENVMLRPDGSAVLLDFGAATAPGTGTRPALGHPGTPGYASPEQRRGEPLAPSSDLYGVGALLWRGLTGEPHPRGRAPPSWAAPLAKATSPRPEDRYQDADAFLAALS